MQMVQAENVIKVYRTGKLEVIALRGLTINVKRGEIVAVMGPSGCGKTTLLNLLGGLDKATAGSINIDGLQLTELDREQLATYRREKIGFVFQFFNLVPWLSAAENIELPLLASGKPPGERQRRSTELLETVNLHQRSQHRPGQLSGGEQQRVAIAAALANDPPLILADEPTGELDTETGQEIMNLFQNLNQEHGKTEIIATHDQRIARIAHRVLKIQDGQIKGEESTHILNHLTLQEIQNQNTNLKQRINQMKQHAKKLQEI